MNKPLNPSAIADDVMTNAPPVTAGMPVPVTTNVEPEPAQPALYEDGVTSRHGKVAARSINMSLKTATGEELDPDMSATLGDILGEIFGLASRHVSRMVYMVMLALCVLPVLAAVLAKILKPAEGKAGE